MCKRIREVKHKHNIRLNFGAVKDIHHHFDTDGGYKL